MLRLLSNLFRQVGRRSGRAGQLKRLRAFRGRLPANFKVDRDEASAR